MSYSDLVKFLDVSSDSNIDKLKIMIPIEQWIEDPYYIGSMNIYPYWKEKIINFFNGNYNSIIFTGSTRSGKSFVSNILFIRQLYELSVYKFQYGSAALKFGLDPSSNISMLILSTTLAAAEHSSLAPLRRAIDDIPYFNEVFPRNTGIQSILSFDEGRILIRPVASYVKSILGINTIALLLDEMNFIGGEETGFRDALDIYSEGTSRIEQTFSTGEDRSYGFKILISSSDTVDSFVESMIEKEESNRKTYIIKSKRFEITPEKFSNKKFFIFAGDKNFEPFFIDIPNKPRYSELLDYLGIDENEKQIYLDYEDISEAIIPERFFDMFENPPINFYNTSIDVTRILRDVCGRSIGIIGNFFSNILAFNNCLDDKLIHPFFRETITVSTENDFNELIDNLKPDFVGKKGILYTISLDLSKRYCDTGISLGHFDIETQKIIIDFMLQVNPPENKMHHIKFKAIQEFIEYLITNRGFKINKFFCDGYQSDFLIEHFSSKVYKMEAKIITVDKTDEPYINLRNIILENQVKFYRYEIFKKEFFSLIHDDSHKKINKSSTGTKDVSDAVCRLIYSLSLNNSRVSSKKMLIPTIHKLIENKKFIKLRSMSKDDVIKQENENWNNQFSN